MRPAAHHGRHARQQAPVPRAYLIALLAALAALVTALSFASQPGQPAQAQVTAPRAPLPDRAAESPATEFAPALQQAQLEAARAALAAARARAAAAAATYTVRSGDSLSAVATRHCGTARDWTGIYAASRARGWTAKNANMLTAGQHLWLSCAYDQRQLRFAPAPPPPPPAATRISSTPLTSGNTGTFSSNRRSAPSTNYSSSTGSIRPATSYEACVIARESGGNSQVMNSSGHYGLYQFSASTWQAYGGSAADFGNASPAEQRRVFLNAMAQGGQSNWSPYDGC